MEKEEKVETKPQSHRFSFFHNYKHSSENDIKYRAPLSYRHLRIAAWVCLMFTAMAVVFSIFGKIENSDGIKEAASVFNTIGNLALPLFMIANFALILRSRGEIKKLLKFHGLVAAAMIAAVFAFIFRYYFSIMTHYQSDLYENSELIIELLMNMNTSKFVFMNVFIDLFLCSLSYFFITYHPKKWFTGKKLIIFRLFVIFPIAYEIASLYLKIHVVSSDFMIPWYIFPFLTTKPPFFYFAFLALTLIFAGQKHRYLKHGFTNEQYHDYVKTNAHSLHFSILTIIIFAGAIIADVITSVIVTSVVTESTGYPADMVADSVMNTGLGQTMILIFFLPLLCLFSYTKEHKNKLIDKAIPVCGILLMAYAVIESIVQLLATL